MSTDESTLIERLEGVWYVGAGAVRCGAVRCGTEKKCGRKSYGVFSRASFGTWSRSTYVSSKPLRSLLMVFSTSSESGEK